MVKPDEWLYQFLQRRCLDMPDGRRLFSYKLDDAEYSELVALLKTWANDTVMSTPGKAQRGLAEVFVLFGAIWWQRHYNGGPWRWKDVLEAFGADEELWTRVRSNFVSSGIRFWRHRLRKRGKLYFGVFVEQGGIPSKLLARAQGGQLASFMHQLMQRAARLGADRKTPENIERVASQIELMERGLPSSLRDPELYSLVAELVTAVLSLKAEHHLSADEDSVAKLDKANPNWRDLFPLPLADEAAKALLNDLVGQAATMRIERRASPFLVDRFLVEREGNYFLASRVTVPKYCSALTLGLSAESPEVAYPRRITIDVIAGNSHASIGGRKALAGSGYLLEELASRVSGTDAIAEHVMQCTWEGGEPQTLPLPGGVALDSNSPWVFVEAGEELRYAGQGSTRLSEEVAFLVVEPEWKVQSAAECEILGDLHGLGGDVMRKIARVCGEAVVRTPATEFRVRTGSAAASLEQLAWKGHRCGWALSPSLAFHERPVLQRFRPDGEVLDVPREQLEWRIAGTSIDVSGSLTSCGPVDVVWRADGEVRLRARMVLLGRGTRLGFSAGASPGSGELRFPLEWNVHEATIQDPTLKVTKHRTGAVMANLSLEASGYPPADIELVLDWAASPVGCKFRVPFPSTGGRFIDQCGKVIRDGSPLPRTGLAGIRLRVFDNNPDRPRKHELCFLLGHHGVGRAGMPALRSVTLDTVRGQLEVRLVDHLEEIDGLFRLTDELDAQVTVSLQTGGRTSASVNIRRYDFAMHEGNGDVGLGLSDLNRLEVESLEKIKVMAVAVSRLGMDDPIPLQQDFSSATPTGRWPLPPGEGPWFVFPASGPGASFRALVAGGAGLAPRGDGERTLSWAFSIPHPAERMQALLNALATLATNPEDPDWDLIEGLWTHTAHLPLPSLDLWRALAQHAPALAAFACRDWVRHDGPEVMQMCMRLDDEVGAAWETIPLHVWRQALRGLNNQLCARYERIGLELRTFQNFVIQAIEERFKLLRQCMRSLDSMLAFVQARELRSPSGYRPPETATVAKLAGQVWGRNDGYVQELRRNLEVPIPALGKDALLPLEDLLPKGLGALLEPYRKEAMHPSVPADEARMMLETLPVMLALMSCQNIRPDWWSSRARLAELRRWRDVDSLYFSNAFDKGVSMALSAGFYSL